MAIVGAAITASSRFSGVDGIFRFMPDGLSQRGFAIMQVTKDGTTEGEGKITYAGKSYDGMMMAKMTQKGESHTMKMNFAGKHTGPCKSPPGKRADDY